MSQTVKQLAEQVRTPVDRLLEQLKDAGVRASGPDSIISDEDKLRLLTHLRKSHGKSADGAQPARITLKRRTQEELKVPAGAPGKSATVNVEYRKKRTYVQRGALEEQPTAAKAVESQAELLAPVCGPRKRPAARLRRRHGARPRRKRRRVVGPRKRPGARPRRRACASSRHRPRLRPNLKSSRKRGQARGGKQTARARQRALPA